MIHNRFDVTARGGAERIVERLTDALRARGHDVVGYHRTTVGFLALHRLPTALRALWHLIDLLNITAVFRLRAMLRRMRPDSIHTHNLIGCGGLTPWVIRRSGVPWIHTLHDVQLITPSGLLIRGRPSTALERSFLGAWFRALRRWLFGSPNVVTAPSRWLLDLHVRHRFFAHADRLVIGNPTEDSTPSVAGRSSEGCPAVRKFSFVGQVEGVKGINVLVEAFRILRGFAPDVVLQVVGDGAALPSLKRAARDVRGLILRGRLDADGVRSAIAEADILIVPSLCAENQPSVILEALACGVPVVASRVGGIPELIRDGETGFLIEPGSTDDLVRALRVCVEEPERVHRMALACRAVAAAHATSAIAERYEAVYTRVAHARRRA